VTFRDDGAAALEWAARYLERVGDYPVLAQVEPGDIRARLPASPPGAGRAVRERLRDLDEILLPGITHWQSPRFFGTSPSAPRSGILAGAARGDAQLVAFLCGRRRRRRSSRR
jgi:aromatic-L-amino-acid decarboxylase